MTLPGPSGACQLAACPVLDGVGQCLIGKTPLTCENYEPDAAPADRSDGGPADRESSTGPTPGDAAAPGDATESATPSPMPARPPATGPDGPHRLVEPADPDGPEVETAAGPQAAETRAPGRQRPPSKVPEPDGPRRLVDLSRDGSVDLPPGLPLTAAEAAEVLAVEHASTVVLAAPPDSGKTTLLAALYESFCRGPVGAWTFAGSATLLGFMQVAWYAGTASGRREAATDRTRIGTQRPWLHLRLGRDGRHRGTLLFADLSGEYFRDVASGQPLGEAGPICERAGHVVHFVDAGLYEAPRERARARQATTDRLRRLAETTAFPPGCLHTVVVSRADLCPAEYRDDLLAGVRQARDRWLPGAPVIEVAARPRDNSTPSGLLELLDALMRPPAATVVTSGPPLRPSVGRVARAGGSGREDRT